MNDTAGLLARVEAGRWSPRWRRHGLEILIGGLLVIWALVPVALLSARVIMGGGVYTGAAGVDPWDQYQYLAWIRDSGQHVFATNLLGLGGGHVFLQPMYLLSGVLWRLGLGLRLSWLLWTPIAAGVLAAGFAAYARRWAHERGRQLAALVLGLLFVSPLVWLSLPATSWVTQMREAVSESSPALQTWLAPHTAIALGLFPLVLMGCERMLAVPSRAWPPSKLVLGTTVGAGLVSWLHSWQGAALLIVICGAAALRRPRRADLILALPAGAAALPLLYEWVLSKLDPAWQLAATLNKRPDLVVLTPQLAVLGLLVVAAIVGAVKHPPRTDGERMLVLWPLAAVLVYRFDPEFPLHALQGITLPLAILAIRGWPGGRRTAAIGVAAVTALTLPGLGYYAKTLTPGLRDATGLFYLSPDQHAAISYLAHPGHSGDVLAPGPLALEVPEFTDRRVWAGHPTWTPPERLSRQSAFYTGTMTTRQTQSFVRSTRVRYVLTDCTNASLPTKLIPIAVSVRRFGCVTVLQIF